MSTDTDTGVRAARIDEFPWAEVLDGLEIKVLRAAAGDRGYTMMVRFAPGFELFTHRHLGEVHAYTLEGRWRYKEYDQTFEAGSYAYEEPGSQHTLVTPADNPGPTTVLFVVDRGQEMLDDDRTLMSTETASTIEGHYRTALEALGVPAPAILR